MEQAIAGRPVKQEVRDKRRSLRNARGNLLDTHRGAYTEEAMSDSFEHQLDLALDQRRQRRLQQQALQARTETAIHDAHEKIEHRQVRFSTAVRSLIAKAVE